MKKTNVLFFAALLLLAMHDSMAGGGWTYKKGLGYFKLAQNVIRADAYFGPTGDVVDLPQRISLYTTSYYGEYGITDRLTAVAYVPFFVRSTLNRLENSSGMVISEGDEINSFGDTDIGLKYGFFQDKPVVMAVSLMFGLPFGHSEVSSTRILQTGDGEFNQMIKLEASHSFYPVPVYVSALVALNNRTNGFSEEYHYGLEVGYTLDRFYANIRLYSRNSFNNSPDNPNQSNTGFANNTEYFSFTPEIAYSTKENWGVTTSAGFAFSGRKNLASPNFGIGIFMEL